MAKNKAKKAKAKPAAKKSRKVVKLAVKKPNGNGLPKASN